jgi:BirA family biotin operon repressor/biotin-[acetyl-CoA-carboxylase] ligase
LTPSAFAGSLHISVEQTDSTNLYARQLVAKQTLPEGTMITALYQTAGIGYAGAAWESEPGLNALISIVLYPEFLEARQNFFLTQAVSLAVCNAAEFLLEKKVYIKWPNDIVVKKKKLAGIKIETEIMGEVITNAVCGIGMNVNQEKFSAPHAISLSSFTGRKFLLQEVYQVISTQLAARYQQLKEGNIAALQKDYMKKLFAAGEETEFVVEGKKFTGRISGLTQHGKLIITSAEGVGSYAFKEIVFSDFA